MDEILKSIQRIIAEDERTSAARPVPPRPAAVTAAADDVFELTEALNDDGTTRRLTVTGDATRPIEPASPTISADERISGHPGPKQDTPRQDALRQDGPRQEAPPLREERIEPVVPSGIGVISGGVLAVGSAVSMVEPEARPEPEISSDTPVPAQTGSRSLEDLVSDLLRPMLKVWLDENLPAVVERLAHAEIARVAEKQGNSAG